LEDREREMEGEMRDSQGAEACKTGGDLLHIKAESEVIASGASK